MQRWGLHTGKQFSLNNFIQQITHAFLFQCYVLDQILKYQPLSKFNFKWQIITSPMLFSVVGGQKNTQANCIRFRQAGKTWCLHIPLFLRVSSYYNLLWFCCFPKTFFKCTFKSLESEQQWELDSIHVAGQMSRRLCNKIKSAASVCHSFLNLFSELVCV